MARILHITKRQEWETAKRMGCYETASLHSQQFIHCSKPEQLILVANFLFRGQADLVLLCIDTHKVVPEICYENLEGGDSLFPHIYGPLNLDAVIGVYDFEPLPNGTFELPRTLVY